MSEFDAQIATLKQNKEIAVCKLKGAIDTLTLLSFQSTLYRVRRQGIKRLVLDIEEISYVNSTGFSVLLKQAEQFKNNAGEIVVANMHPKIKLVFDVLGLGPFVRVFSSVDEGVSALLDVDAEDSEFVSSSPSEEID